MSEPAPTASQPTDVHPSRWRDWGTWLLVAIIVYIVVHLIWLVFPWGNTTQRQIIGSLLFLIPYAAAFLLSARLGRNRRLDARARRAWWILAAGFGTYFIANVIYTYQEITLTTIPFPSIADGIFALSYVFWLWGILTFPTEAITDHDRATIWLDASIIMVGFGSVIWVLGLQPTFTAQYADWLSAAISISYPLGSLMLLFGIVTIIYRRPIGTSHAAFYWLGFSFFCLTFGDISYSYFILQGSYYSGFFWTDSLYALSALALVVAPQVQYWHLHAPATATTTWGNWLRRLRILLPYIAVALSYSVLITLVSGQLNTVPGQMILVAVGLTILVSLSQARANQAMVQAQHEAETARAALADSAAQLAQANTQLEQRVAARTAELEQALVAQEAQAAELRESIVIQEQLSATIIAQSVPIIPVREDALVAPIIGVIDSERAEFILRTILNAVEERKGVRLVFLDVTGVARIDTASAQVIIQIMSAVQLLGAELVLVGVRPELAQALVERQMDLAPFHTVATLQQGLRDRIR